MRIPIVLRLVRKEGLGREGTNVCAENIVMIFSLCMKPLSCNVELELQVWLDILLDSLANFTWKKGLVPVTNKFGYNNRNITIQPRGYVV